MRKLLALVCSLAVAAVSVFSLSLPASADVLLHGHDDIYMTSLDALIENYGLSERDLSGEWYLCGGYQVNYPDIYTLCLYLPGSEAYRVKYDLRSEIPTFNYHSGSYGFTCGSYSLGAPFLQEYYYNAASDSSQIQLDFFACNSTDIYNHVNEWMKSSCPVDFTVKFFSDTCLLGELSSGLFPESVDPTEDPTSGSAGVQPFTIPDEWIYGGETLAPAETQDFTVDIQGALDGVDSLDVSIDTGVTTGISVFWFTLIEFINALDVMPIVLLSMTIGLLTYFFGRNL